MSVDRLHPGLVHHIANTLGWSDLRPLQKEAIGPILDGEDTILLAPTAGGKTEASSFPLISAMASQEWNGLSVLYLCPIKALLNNLAPRLEAYAGWMGRTVGLWHGDIGESVKNRMRADPPNILLTTPESLEGLLISTKTETDFFANLRAVVVDEVHAFASDDRGWHLRAVLERLTRLAGRPLQRIGASATVGNPDELLKWLQGAGIGRRPGRVIAPGVLPVGSQIPENPPSGEIELDYVGSVSNAAKVIATLHRGEKRLVFCDSRKLVEQLAGWLREFGVTVFLSHSSLSVGERRRAEQAFAEARDCVIVATSTLELGIDVGDLDRVIQINAPKTVASFLQRLGRTGRRSGSVRNCLFLAIDKRGLLDAAGLLRLWGRHWVEPVAPPPGPNHIVAQQILALCLQEHRVGDRLWPGSWNGLKPFDAESKPILEYLVAEGFIETDGGMLFIGPNAEKRFGSRHFADLTAVFCAPPEFTVLHGREEIGQVDPSILIPEEGRGTTIILLAGRTWYPKHIDWKRRLCYVDPAEGEGSAKWSSAGLPTGKSFALAQSIRAVVLGEDPPVKITSRAEGALADLREKHVDHVDQTSLIIRRSKSELRWWTWAGYRANLTLQASLDGIARADGVSDFSLRLEDSAPNEVLSHALSDAVLVPPTPDVRAVNGLKFNDALPEELARATLAARLSDLPGAHQALRIPRHFASG
ncbi:DEAD/DEAH box helicase [Natronoglycomyces albus]|uniref:DEAD/DEAH box helicase n=1 Tax=Natronoglycomyces albus TaxID=2811108 RepID=A0A895XRF8_9ACTN|nr:DEAD/DEAH box helicase [Natronoglycomyces albus]QSB05146.1 DEAD/DEAH box helicase [Natronoglycomyces albus]